MPNFDFGLERIAKRCFGSLQGVFTPYNSQPSGLASDELKALFNVRISTILIVEDNQDDAFIIQRALTKANVLNPLKLVPSGELAISYLAAHEPYTNPEENPLPGLVLLDLKMPGIDGFEVLQWIRQQPRLQELHVVVLTSSTDVRDVNLAIHLGADGFIIKPADFLRFVEFSQALAGSWVWMQKNTPFVATSRECNFGI